MLLEQGQHGPLVLFVDDMHLLDVTSATFIGQLLDADLLFLVGTVRDGEALPAGLDAVVAARPACAGSISPTSTATASTRCCTWCSAARSKRTTINDFWEASRGNPLYVRELVLGALDGGHLFVQHGVWRLGRPARHHAAAGELVAARLRSLSPSVLDALDHVAVWEPVGPGDARGRRRARSARGARPRRAADRPRRRSPPAGDAVPPAVPRDPARPHAGADPASAAARAGRPHRGPRRPPSRGPDPRRPSPASTPPGRPTRRSLVRAARWPATTTTSCSVERLGRAALRRRA